MGKVFVLDPTHVNFVPQRSKLNQPMLYTWRERFRYGGWIFALLVVFPCSLFGLWLGFGEYAINELNYRSHGVTTVATVVACKREVSGSGASQSIRISLTYHYTVSNSEMSVTEQIPRPETLCSDVPEQITVQYLDNNPSSVRVIDERVDTSQLKVIHLLVVPFVLLFYFWSVGALGLLILPMLIFEKLQVPLLEHKGKILEGEILSCTATMTRDHRYLVTVTYRFSVRKRTLQGILSNTRADLVREPLPPAGTPIKVLYVNRFCYLPL